ncbi:hypothetical protein DEAC_c16390 [Desulfosporosinus acididurans]|uniref:Uncharacterized protein n=1 Tax=Desulfosporosinus acididurans TaxID=476652 RepID=A0A0J1FRX5_9FIRM|nr:hypothetical protein DEAC_c16390 [Desulfosporosinus acididurans]
MIRFAEFSNSLARKIASKDPIKIPIIIIDNTLIQFLRMESTKRSSVLNPIDIILYAKNTSKLLILTRDVCGQKIYCNKLY